MKLPVIPTLMSMLIGLPLLGTAIAGKPILPYITFPPTMPHLQHAGFSWPVFVVIAAVALILLVGTLWLLNWKGSSSQPTRHYAMPIWGWWALAVWIVSWILAWTRFAWFSEYQYFTFAPLWVSFIVLLNAITYRRSGRSLISHEARYFASLFLFSAVFWWYFEFLNRFVQNWYYDGLAPGGMILYISSSTIAFSTVLPGVISMCELLRTYPLFASSQCRLRFHVSARPVASVLLVVACTGLLLIGVYPDILFPLLWGAPLMLIVALQLLRGESTILSRCASGEWHYISRPMIAALICGFFWEMWNANSYTVWHYALPYVNSFHIFEMPILGYAGYLPFGLECVVAAHLMRPCISYPHAKA